MGRLPKSLRPRVCRLAALSLLVAACSTGPAADAVEPASSPADAIADAEGPPTTPKRPVADTYHGMEVVDDYRWLEDWSDPEVKAWSEAQNVYARAHLDALPGLEVLRGELREILGAKVVENWSIRSAGGRIFALEDRPPAQQPILVRLSDLDGEAKRTDLVDPNLLDEAGLTHIDWFVPSPDGTKLAVSMSKGGSEVGDLYLFDAETGKRLPDFIERVNAGTAGGSVAWAPDNQGFFYTRYPRKGERPDGELDLHVRVHFHALGSDPAEDRYELGEGFPAISEYRLDAEEKTGRVIATVQHGDGGEFRHLLRDPKKGTWTQFSDFGDGIKHAGFGKKGELLIVSRADAPRGKLMALPAKHLGKREPKVLVPEGEDTIVTSFWSDSTVRRIGDRIFVLYQTGGPSELRVFDAKGRAKPPPAQLPVSAVSSPHEVEGKLLFSNGSYVEPRAWYLQDPKSGEVSKTKLAVPPTVDLSSYEVRREFATSKDGTKVPLNIVAPPGVKLDGSNPCIVTGYGGYGISLGPRYQEANAPLLERGVIHVVANLRGGAEFGEQWHLDGATVHKQNVFDDFAAVLEHLVERGYTKPEKLAITGGSNGGLLMGATFTQRPELVKAVVTWVGIYDMLRVELSPNGNFNIPEFGTVKDPAQFEALHAYSPYHHVRDGADYPAVLFVTGANDPRVDPMQSRKMSARMQAAVAGVANAAPVLLRTNDDAGHGSGTPLDERINQSAHAQAFLASQLGVALDGE